MNIPKRIALFTMLVLGALTANLCAIPLVLHGTGEGLNPGDADPNWTVTLPNSTPFGNAISAVDGGWFTPTGSGTWISTVTSGSVPLGTYQYSTTFEIGAGLDASTAMISGDWYSDDQDAANGIWLNGIQVSTFQGSSWNGIGSPAFTLSSGFISGTNTLTFRVTNTGGPGGTLVENLSGSADRVPDSGASVAFLGLALVGLGALRRRFM